MLFLEACCRFPVLGNVEGLLETFQSHRELTIAVAVTVTIALRLPLVRFPKAPSAKVGKSYFQTSIDVQGRPNLLFENGIHRYRSRKNIGGNFRNRIFSWCCFGSFGSLPPPVNFNFPIPQGVGADRVDFPHLLWRVGEYFRTAHGNGKRIKILLCNSNRISVFIIIYLLLFH